jgi:hypothetical protein
MLGGEGRHSLRKILQCYATSTAVTAAATATATWYSDIAL